MLSMKAATQHCSGNPGDSLLSRVADNLLCLMKLELIAVSYT